MRKLFDKYSVKGALTVFLLLFMLLPSMLLWVYMKENVVSRIKNEYTPNYVHAALAEIRENIDNLQFRLNMDILSILNSREIYTCMNSDIGGEQKKETMGMLLRELMENTMVSAAFLISDVDGSIYEYNPQGLELIIDESFLYSFKKTHIVFAEKVIKTDKTSYLAAGKVLQNDYNGKIGRILIYIDENMMCDTYKSATLDGSQIFITINDTIISHSDKMQINKSLYIPFGAESSNQIFVFEQPSDYLNENMRICVMISNKSIYSLVNKINRNLLIVFVLSGLACGVTAFFIPHKSMRHIMQIKSQIDRYRLNMTEYTPVKCNNEISCLDTAFCELTQKITLLIHEIKIEKDKERKAELKALQMQINPHFIYNALDTMSWLASINHQEDIRQMAHALALFFRIGLSKGESVISVADEIAHVKSYLSIIKISYPELVSVSFSISEEINKLYMLKTVIQPIVENCIKHAFKKESTDNRILISGCIEGGDLVFKVEDNGVGMEFDPLAKKEGVIGYGILNTQQRIQLHYGTEYGLEFVSKVGSGTKVTVRLKPIYNPVIDVRLDEKKASVPDELQFRE